MGLKKQDRYKVENAVIMAAGLSSRFAPLSYERPKALLKVKGEILIERQIRQLKEAGIQDISVVVGYKKELFDYLTDKFAVKIIENPEYKTRNNHSSLYYARKELKNTYICSADNYLAQNVFEAERKHSYYSAVYEEGITDEWCLTADETGLITDVQVGCKDSWVMLGPAFFSEDFSEKFVDILEKMYDSPQTKSLLWEQIFVDHLEELPMFIEKYEKDVIFEFDSLEELRTFDPSYIDNTNSEILTEISTRMNCPEKDISEINPIKQHGITVGFEFYTDDYYKYFYETQDIVKLNEQMENKICGTDY